MASQLQLRRGTTVQHGSFIGAGGEITVDVDKKTLVVHDGATLGGFPVLSASGGTVTGPVSMAAPILMGGSKIADLATPTAPNDAASKGYVDGIVAAATLADADYGDVTVSGGATVWTIDNAAVTETKIADGAVTSAKIANGTIVDANISAGAAIAYGKLDLNDSIVTGDLTDDAVTTAKIDDGAVTEAKINDAAVTAAKLDGAQTGSAPIYGCRAWVNFDGNFTAVTGNNYSRTGTTVTVTKTAHGLQSGNRLVIASATDTGLNTASNTASAEITFVDVNSFSFQTNSTGTSTGTLTYRRGIFQSGNVASVARTATGKYVITFITAMADSRYCVISSGNDRVPDATFRGTNNISQNNTPSTCEVWHKAVNSAAQAIEDGNIVNVAIFR